MHLQRQSETKIIYFAFNVNDNLLKGYLEDIEDTVRLLQRNGLILIVEDDLNDYCCIKSCLSKIRKSMADSDT